MSQPSGVLEIVMGKHQLLVSHDKNSAKATMRFHGRDRDRPNMVRVLLYSDTPRRPYQIGGDAFAAATAARHIVSTFVEKATT